ncbi:MAG TPA: hypothetical protein VH143_33135 [Kofleriaceae bacterium]|jgi:hypothetical protein|nr:hypothetical protein [Kofleriaceae bacterium]
MVRTGANGLPGPDQPIDLDRAPFITQGIGPDGSIVRYYNFDIQADTPATRYRLTHAGARAAIPGELDFVDLIPGDARYSDFWRIAWVEVPADFIVGSITSVEQLRARGFPIGPDPTIIDCPIVPRGSTAREAHGVAAAVASELWYRGARVSCLDFGDLAVDANGHVPTSPIYVTFARNPPEGGPASGFRTEITTPQTHNVVMSVPGDVDYSPLWAVHIYDRAAFDRVHDAASALAAPLLEPHGPLVNCPVVYIGTSR